MKIEKLTEQDMVPLAELFEQFWNEKSSTEKMRETFSRLFSNPAYILLVAKQDDRLVGFVMGVICEELYGDCKPFLVVEDMIINNAHRQNGAGTALMLELEKIAAYRECCQIILVTESSRTSALQFYKSLGYEFEPYKGFKKRIRNGQDMTV
jgi:ribosomal protein S18 acetylase RimI-like enzyme